MKTPEISLFKLFVLFLFTSQLFGVTYWSQKSALQAENLESGQQILIQPNTEVVLTTINNKYHGYLIIFNDSMVKIGSDLLFIRDLVSLKTKNLKQRKTGIKLMVIGASGVGLGCILYSLTTVSNIVNAFQDLLTGSSSGSESYRFAKSVIFSGGATFVTGVVLVAKKQSYARDRFAFSILIM